jgi:hypothetical protein
MTRRRAPEVGEEGKWRKRTGPEVEEAEGQRRM